jgi:hypothetical protein
VVAPAQTRWDDGILNSSSHPPSEPPWTAYLQAELIEEEWGWLGEKMRYYRRPCATELFLVARCGSPFNDGPEALPSGVSRSRLQPWGITMSVPMILLPVFVQVALTFILLFGMGIGRGRAVASGAVNPADVSLRQPNWPTRVTQIGNCFANQFEIPVLFYVLIALALPLRHADLIVVMLSWIFVVTRFAHAGIFVTSNDLRTRSLAWFAGALVVLAMWIYFALRILL